MADMAVEAVVGEAVADAALVAAAFADSTFQCNDKQFVAGSVKFNRSDLKATQDIQFSKPLRCMAISLDRLTKI
jgi:hypothetical protein